MSAEMRNDPIFIPLEELNSQLFHQAQRESLPDDSPLRMKSEELAGGRQRGEMERMKWCAGSSAPPSVFINFTL
jgi:hypothetical protein